MRKALLAALALTTTATATALTLGTSPALSDSSTVEAAETGMSAKRLDIVGLTSSGTTLVTVSSNNPAKARSTVAVTGLTGDARLVGVDYRAADGRLYGLGDQGGIYTLAPSGAATAFGRLTVALEGTAFGVDVNPAADALRIVSNTGQNLRQAFATPAGPTAVDTRLSTPPTVGDTTGIAGAAYTNNDASPATATTLYDISTTTDSVLVQAPANSGTLSPTGLLGVDATGDAGFDIYSFVQDGKAQGQRAYAALTVGGRSSLYAVTLFNGEARRVGALPQQVTDIAIPLGQ